MCGIFFYLLKNIKNTEKDIKNIVFNSFNQISSRGPDKTVFKSFSINDKKNDYKLFIGFHRLSILDLSHKGDQPFIYENSEKTIITICNGEIYNYRELIKKFNLHNNSNSDCEVIHNHFVKYNNINFTYEQLLGEFSFIIINIDKKNNNLTIYAGRDTYGVRPLFYFVNENEICLSSEMKGLINLSNNSKDNLISPFPPNNVMTFIPSIENNSYFFHLKKLYTIPEYKNIYKNKYKIDILNTVKSKLIEAVKIRLNSERSIGALLSGGIDSSIVAAIAAKELETQNKKLKTFSIGTCNSTDLYYANMVAKHINSEHTVIDFCPKIAVNYIEEVVKTIESYDITTVRASIVQYLLAKYIRENTDVKVILNGDGNDELAGSYLYFHNYPSREEFHNECVRLLNEIYLYDGLRVDRTLSGNGLEARLPFLDTNFVDYYLNIDVNLRVPRSSNILNIEKNIEKPLIREAFYYTNYLPISVLCRKKEAFSDGCSNENESWFKILQNHIEKIVTDTEYNNEKHKYKFNTPISKESYYYRKIFEKYYGENSNVIPHYWLPKWCGNVNDPSARVLKVYND